MSDSQHSVVLDEEFVLAAEVIRRNAEIRKQIDEEDKAAKEILAKVLTDGEVGTDENGKPLVKVRAGARVWNEAEAVANLPAPLLERITVTRTVTEVDKDLAKEILPPALYEKCTRQNRSSILPA